MSREPGARILARRFAARPDQLRRIRRALARALEGAGVDPDGAADTVLAVDEACQNVIRHGYRGAGGDILLSVHCRQGELVIEIRDFAAPVDPARIRPRALDELRPGGLGTHFIRSVMDRVEYLPAERGRGNLLRMIRRIGPS